MFFIHGGAFYAGTQIKMGPERLGDVADIVLVAINYRVGPLGIEKIIPSIFEVIDNLVKVKGLNVLVLKRLVLGTNVFEVTNVRVKPSTWFDISFFK
jgi:hypothetical protein